MRIGALELMILLLLVLVILGIIFAVVVIARKKRIEGGGQIETYDIHDIKATIPKNIRNRLLSDEKVLYYASGGGCLRGPRTYFLITDSRAMLTAVRKGGCLGIGTSTGALDIPLEHITSVGTETSGCLFARSGVVSVSSGTASERVVLTTPKAAEEASITLQKILREQHKGG